MINRLLFNPRSKSHCISALRSADCCIVEAAPSNERNLTTDLRSKCEDQLSCKISELNCTTQAPSPIKLRGSIVMRRPDQAARSTVMQYFRAQGPIKLRGSTAMQYFRAQLRRPHQIARLNCHHELNYSIANFILTYPCS